MAVNKSKLMEKLEEYLSNPSSHEEIQKYVWDEIDAGENIPSSEPYEQAEEVFWATIWSLQHLADDDHIKLETTKTEFKTLLSLLKSGGSLPEGWVGKRPYDK